MLLMRPPKIMNKTANEIQITAEQLLKVELFIDNCLGCRNPSTEGGTTTSSTHNGWRWVKGIQVP